jgi:hypothetical protein
VKNKWIAFAGCLLLIALPAVAQENDVKSSEPPAGIPADGGSLSLAVGPDAFGYTAADETEATGPAFSFVDISGTGTAAGLTGDDAGTGALSIGFPFDFYGTSYTSFAASTNGYINFNTGGDLVDFGNDCPGLNAFDPDQSLYVLWDDLIMDAGTSELFTETFTECPNTSGGFGACTVVQWNQVRHLGGVDLFDVQAILYDTNNMLVQLSTGEPEGGAGATIGIENETPSSIGLDYACNTAGSMPANRGVLFCYPGNVCPAVDGGPEEIPTLGDAGIAFLLVLLAGAGVFVMRRRMA